jgi:hypothetical protein
MYMYTSVTYTTDFDVTALVVTIENIVAGAYVCNTYIYIYNIILVYFWCENNFKLPYYILNPHNKLQGKNEKMTTMTTHV